MTRVKAGRGTTRVRLRVLQDRLVWLKGSIVFVLLLASMNASCTGAISQLSKPVQDPQPTTLLKIATSALPNGEIQSPYQASLIASGGTLPYAWKIQSGQIPWGLSLNSSIGAISGTPESSGQFVATFAVTDSSQPPRTARTALTFEIALNDRQSLAINATALPNGQVSQTYGTTFTATGGTAPYSWGISSGNVPPGLNLASANGKISGIPNTNGEYQFTVKVVDSSTRQRSATQSNAITINDTTFDQYGGFANMPSPNAPTGIFRAEKFGNKWMLVDPDNNGLFMIGMCVLAGSSSIDERGSSYNARVTAKYGDSSSHWATAQLQRIQSWGYNTVGPYAYDYTLPFKTDDTWNTPDHTNPVKLPFIGQIRPSLYGMQNENNWAPQPTKNMLYGLSKFYTGYRPNVGVADYYDNNLSVFLATELAKDPYPVAIKASSYKQYLIGMNADDSDEMYGFGNGPDFKTGYSNAHLGWLVLTMSPSQTANSSKGFVYPDATVYSKKALRDQLAAKYGNIGTLNSAWGSNYTTFDSSGSGVVEAIGSGDDSTLSFSRTLTDTTVTAFTLQILVDGQVVAGDQGDGTVWGPKLNGSIDYATGALNLSFSSENAPASGAAITANYVKNGWGIGSGLMDEDGRISHQIWTGIDFVSLLDVNVAVKLDLDNFLFQIADHYFSMCRTLIQTWMPGVMYLGPTSLGTWGAPSNRNVLKAAARDIDVMEMAAGPAGPLTQPMLDFIFAYYGDKPFYVSEFRLANPDSAFFSYTADGAFATQEARGQDYFNAVTNYPSASYGANGSRPYVGVFWWQYLDNWSEKNNWGLVSLSDNAYDGREAVTGPGGVGVRSVPCSAPLESFMCGGEERNYGDVVSVVKSAHQQIIQAVQH